MNSRFTVLAFLALGFSPADAQNPVSAASAERDSMAVYCTQVHRLSLAQLNLVYARIPGSAESPAERDQLAKHTARVANAEKYVNSRIDKLGRSRIDDAMGKETAEFWTAENDTNACIQSCLDDRCRAQCITKPSPANRRVDSCMRLVW